MFDLNDCKIQMLETVQAHESELKNIRTGRVSPDILKTIIVDSYGSKMPLTQLANINNLDNMTLSVSIWDSSLVKSIENFINQEELIELLKNNNFQNCSYRNLSGGIVAIHSGWKL